MSTPTTGIPASERRVRFSELWNEPEKLYSINESAPGNLTSMALDPRRQVVYVVDGNKP